MCMTAEEMRRIHEEMLERQRIEAEGKKIPPRDEVKYDLTSWRFE